MTTAPDGKEPATDLFGVPVSVSQNSVASGALRGKRILVVDDNLINLDIASEALQLAGAFVDSAASGSEALTMASRRAYDLIVLDLAMPGMNGVAVGHAIRASNGNPTVPILLFSASDLAEIKSAAREIAAVGVVSKPVDIDDLLRSAVKHA